jgi:2-amino-4-hydroxy-6-hydroxymethyldihydropteridine diphosphokinase
MTRVAGSARGGVSPAGPVTGVVLSLGSNLGDRAANLQRGVTALCGNGLACRRVSAVYQTAPVGGPEQDDYLNAVLLAESRLTGKQVLAMCVAAEAAAGRVRTVRWGPRTLDVDVISYGNEVSAEPDLTLPHPRAHERTFVLVPWLEIDPDAWLPGYGAVADLPAAAATAGIRRLASPRLVLPGAAPEGADHEVAPCR